MELKKNYKYRQNRTQISSNFKIKNKWYDTSDYISPLMYKELFNQMNRGVGIYSFESSSQAFIIKDFNPAGEKFLGVKRVDVVGKSLVKVLPSLENSEFIEALVRVYKTGKPENIQFSHYKDNRINIWKDNYLFKLSSGEIVSIFQDVFDIVKLNEKIQRYNILFEGTRDLILFLDSERKIIEANSAALQTYGYSREEILSKKIDDIRESSTIGDLGNLFNKARLEGVCFETIHRKKNGEAFPVEVSSVGITIAEEDIICSIIRDISERKKAEEEIVFLTYHDRLTGVYNRLYFDYKVSTLSPNKENPIGIIMADVNGLKLVNDAFGHQEGDKLLIEASRILVKSCYCKRNSKVARIGGDEFVAFLPNTNEEEIKSIIDCVKVECEMSSEGYLKPSIALGYSILDREDFDFYNSMKAAEDMMYTNKLIESKSLRSSLITSLQKTLHQTTPETNEHCQRMRDMAIKFGRALKLTQENIDKLALLALIHDIGIIAVPKDIVDKKGKLTEKEWEIMKRHSIIGYNIANSSPQLSSIAEMILYHHERWDGMGYPQGISGEKIPLLSRIIAILDAYDAMVSQRIYRAAITREEAIKELVRNSGLQFDSELVEVFINFV